MPSVRDPKRSKAVRIDVSHESITYKGRENNKSKDEKQTEKPFGKRDRQQCTQKQQ